MFDRADSHIIGNGWYLGDKSQPSSWSNFSMNASVTDINITSERLYHSSAAYYPFHNLTGLSNGVRNYSIMADFLKSGTNTAFGGLATDEDLPPYVYDHDIYVKHGDSGATELSIDKTGSGGYVVINENIMPNVNYNLKMQIYDISNGYLRFWIDNVDYGDYISDTMNGTPTVFWGTRQESSLSDYVVYDNVTFASGDAWENDLTYTVSASQDRSSFIEDSAPNLSIVYPTATSYVNVTELNYTVSDDYGLSACWYDATGTNVTVTCGNNITGLNSSDGSNTWIMYANDTSGNLAVSTVTFSITRIGVPDSDIFLIDYESNFVAVMFLIFFAICGLLFFMRMYIFAGGILGVLGFVLLYSGFLPILSFIVIIMGVLCFFITK
jgi:hypothetical protein